MGKLIEILRALVEHAVPQGNAQGELHGLIDELDKAIEVLLAAQPVAAVAEPGPAAPAEGQGAGEGAGA